MCPLPTNERRDENQFRPDVTENPSGGLLRRPDIRRISALRRAGSGPCSFIFLGIYLAATTDALIFILRKQETYVGLILRVSFSSSIWLNFLLQTLIKELIVNPLYCSVIFII